MAETFRAVQHSNNHIPNSCSSLRVVNKIINNEKVAIIGNVTDTSDITIFTINDCKIICGNESNITEEWLKTKLDGNHCYLPVYGSCSWLPVLNPDMWVISSTPLDKTNFVDYSMNNLNEFNKSRGYHYAEILYSDETCIAELICNAYCYKFDAISNTYIRHNDTQWNAIKPSVRRFLPSITGGTEDRLADYGKLLLYILNNLPSKDSLPENVKMLLAFAPANDELSTIVQRETLVQKFVSEAKKDPKTFLEWKENWGKFWWETNE